MNILPRSLIFLSHEKSRMAHALNESLKITQRLLALRIVPNRMISYPSFNRGKNESVTDASLFLRRNVNKDLIARLKRGNTQSSWTGKDGTKQPRDRIEDQSAKEAREWRSDGYQISTESCQKPRDLLNHREHHHSSKSNSSSCENKSKCNNKQTRESKQATGVTSKKWTCGKPATEGIYYKCKPEPDTCPESREKTCFPPRDRCKDRSDEVTKDKSRQIKTYPAQRCPASKPASSKEIISSEKIIYPADCETSQEFPRLGTYEYHVKPDPPVPRYPYWKDNPPPYCDLRTKETTPVCTVKSSPMFFFPKKGRWKKTQAKDPASFPRNIQEDSDKSPKGDARDRKTDAEAPRSQESEPKKRCVISLEDKCSLTKPRPVDATESKRQYYPLTKDGRCLKKEKVTTLDVSDCNPNMASFKHRLSKCPSTKEMCDKPEPPVDINAQKQEALSSCKKVERPESQPKTTGEKKKKCESQIPDSNGWTQQRYKVRLKIFHKESGRLDPCLSQIIEVRQPREKIKSKQLKSIVDKGESSSRNSCPDYPSEMPIAETKSYPTKMKESKVTRDGKRTCEEDR